MALNKGEGSGTIYLNVSGGKLVRSFQSPTESSKERISKTGKTVHEEMYRDVVGIIKDVESKENDFGKQLVIEMEDGGEKYLIRMPFSSRYSSSFLKALPNLKFGEPVRLMTWEMADKNDAAKKITGITCYQDDGNGFQKILPAFTKDNHNGLPEMKKVKIKGKDTWDDYDMMAFLFEKAKSWLSEVPF